MKYFNMLVALTLVMVMAVSLGTAGSASGGSVKTASAVSNPEQIGPRHFGQIYNDPDAQGLPAKSAARAISKDVIEALSSPAPTMSVNKALTRSTYAAGLSGTYTIPGDFPSLDAAVSVLNFVGLSGNATFVLGSASYSQPTPLTIGSFPGGGSFTATFEPAAATAVTISFTSSASVGKGLVFNGAKGVTFDGLNTGGASLLLQMTGAFPSSDAFAATVYITGASEGIALKNLSVTGQYDNAVFDDQTDGRPAVFVWNGNGENPNANITFDGLTVTHASYAFKSLSYLGSNSTIEGLTFTNNKIGSAYGDPVVNAGLWTYVYNVNVSNNVFDGIRNLQTYWYYGTTEYDDDEFFGGVTSFFYDLGQTTAMGHWLGVHTGTFANNIGRNVTTTSVNGDGIIMYAARIYGLNLGYGGTYQPTLVNNRIYNLWNDDGTASRQPAMQGFRGPNHRQYHNSVRITGVTANNAGATGSNVGSDTHYNNAYSVEVTPATTRHHGIETGGTYNNCAIYSSGIPTSAHTTVAAAVAAGVNPNGIFGPVNFTSDLHITAGPSSAEDIGRAKVILLADIDSDVRDTTTAGTRDAGADEFASTGSPVGADVLPTAIVSPVSGIPSGVASSVTVQVKNNANSATGAFNLRVTVAGDPYDNTVSVSLDARETKTITFPAWTPASAATWVFTAVSSLGGDTQVANDTSAKSVVVSAPIAISADTTFDFNAGAQGWVGTLDWKLKTALTKLGGLFGGSGRTWATERPNATETYTEGAYGNTQGYATTYPGANFLYSPWMNISGLSATDVYLSFYHSIQVEPLWDRSWLQYTTNGVTWNTIGVLDDPNGVNWYSSAVYANAPFDSVNFDLTTCETRYGIARPSTGSWTSNGPDGLGGPTGPSGYVYNQIHLTSGTYPSLVGASTIQFRYIAFSDAVNPVPPNGDNPTSAFGGWSFDNFRIGSTAPVLSSASVSGTVYTDVDGNGANGAEPAVAGAQVDLKYFGVHVEYDTTDGSGNYSFTMNLPGTYQIVVTTPLAKTQPIGGTQVADYSGNGVNITGKDFGLYAGSISGTVYNDVNDDGANVGEPALSGWTVELHADSANGTLLATTTSDGSGNYSFAAVPGTYGVKEVVQASGRKTEPVASGYSGISVSGTSGSGSANPSGYAFGNWLYAKIRINLTVDINGDGIVGGGDVLPLPAVVGTISVFTTKKDGSTIYVDTLGNGVASVLHDGLNTGSYDVIETSFTPGWVRTKGGTFTHNITTSGVSDTAKYMDFKLLTISGKKFKDVNGNGVDDSEPGLAGWTINVSGSALGATSAVTDTLGLYSIDSVSVGLHNITETPQAGWTQTLPATSYSFTAVSGNLPNPVTGRDFGNFENYSISGTKFIDRNNDGTRDPEDNGLSGWTINLNPGALTTVTDANGDYSFTNVGPGTMTLSETTQPGWYQSAPVGGTYTINGVSGTNVTGQDFGNFKATDSTAYRTFTAAQLQADNQKKPAAYKAGKPILAGPNTANLLKDMFLQGAVIKVGLAGQLNAGGKEKAYIQPAKYTDVWKGLNAKSVYHTGAARGLDLDVKGKLLLKRYKALPPTKKNDALVANLMALQINLAASGLKTPAGLGALMYNEAGHPFNGMSIDAIAAYADTVMTNWEGQPYSVYVMLDSVAAKINAAFASGVVDDTTATGGFTSPKLQWMAYTAVMDVPFLKATGNQAKTRIAPVTIEQIPVDFALSQNYPNPFNPATTIQFDLPEQSMVTLKIYNMLGQEVATLLDREEIAAGQEELEFDASSLASGVYLYRIVAESVNNDGAVSQAFTQVKKMVLMK